MKWFGRDEAGLTDFDYVLMHYEEKAEDQICDAKEALEEAYNDFFSLIEEDASTAELIVSAKKLQIRIEASIEAKDWAERLDKDPSGTIRDFEDDCFIPD